MMNIIDNLKFNTFVQNIDSDDFLIIEISSFDNDSIILRPWIKQHYLLLNILLSNVKKILHEISNNELTWHNLNIVEHVSFDSRKYYVKIDLYNRPEIGVEFKMRYT